MPTSSPLRGVRTCSSPVRVSWRRTVRTPWTLESRRDATEGHRPPRVPRDVRRRIHLHDRWARDRGAIPAGRHEGRRRGPRGRATRAGRADGAVPRAAARRPAARGASTGSRHARCGGTIVPRAATTGTTMPVRGRRDVPRLHLPAHDGRVRRARRRRPRCPGPSSTAEVGDLIVVHFRNADEELRPAGDDAPARGPLQPRLRRLVRRRLHAPRRLRGARRGVHVPVGGDARTASACGRTTTTDRTTCSTRSAGSSARSSSGSAGRRRPTSSRCSRCTRSRRRSRGCARRCRRSTAARTPATRRRSAPGSARTSRCT